MLFDPKQQTRPAGPFEINFGAGVAHCRAPLTVRQLAHVTGEGFIANSSGLQHLAAFRLGCEAMDGVDAKAEPVKADILGGWTDEGIRAVVKAHGWGTVYLVGGLVMFASSLDEEMEKNSASPSGSPSTAT